MHLLNRLTVGFHYQTLHEARSSGLLFACVNLATVSERSVPDRHRGGNTSRPWANQRYVLRERDPSQTRTVCDKFKLKLEK